MGRISIDVTDAQHQQLKALAALQGKSIKEFVLERTLGDADQADAIAELQAILERRIARADAEGWSSRTVKELFDQAREEPGRSPDG